MNTVEMSRIIADALINISGLVLKYNEKRISAETALNGITIALNKVIEQGQQHK